MKYRLIMVTLAASATLVAGPAVAGEFGDHCALGEAFGKVVPTTCEVKSEIDGKTYCFSSAQSQSMFMLDAKGNIAKAAANYAARQSAAPADGKSAE